MAKSKRTVRFWLLMAVALLAPMACHRIPDEQVIRQSIETTATATEQLDVSAVLGALTDDFDGNDGTMARNDLGNLLRLARFRGETLHVLVGPIDVQAKGERYVADFTVTLSSGGKVFPAQLGVYNVETAWRREGRDWRCYQATWKQQL